MLLVLIPFCEESVGFEVASYSKPALSRSCLRLINLIVYFMLLCIPYDMLLLQSSFNDPLLYLHFTYLPRLSLVIFSTNPMTPGYFILFALLYSFSTAISLLGISIYQSMLCLSKLLSSIVLRLFFFFFFFFKSLFYIILLQLCSVFGPSAEPRSFLCDTHHVSQKNERGSASIGPESEISTENIDITNRWWRHLTTCSRLL